MASKMKDELRAPEPYQEPPPPYQEKSEEAETSSDSSDDDDLDRNLTDARYAPASGGLPLPVVVPQTSTSFKGAFFSPFVRAYVPGLEAHGITKDEFVTFIDGLNESFVTHPAFQGLGLVGTVLTMCYGVSPAQWAGMGLQVAAGVTGAATSYLRTRAYVKATNQDLFHPAGLHLNVLTTKKLMEKVKYPHDKLQLPPLDWDSDLPNNAGVTSNESAQAPATGMPSQDDPRLRRIQALEGYVMPIDLNVPKQDTPDNFLKKMSAANAARMERKQNRKMEKRRAKAGKGGGKLEKLEIKREANEAALERIESSNSYASDKSARKLQKRQYKLERKLAKKSAKMESKSADKGKREKKIAKVEKRESKAAQKIRWLVIAKREEDENSDDDSLPNSEDEGEGREEETGSSIKY